MNEVEQFKNACRKYLQGVSLNDLRVYGRSLSLQSPTKRNKAELIEEIVATVCGELIPKRNKKGAPIKNGYLAPTIPESLERLKRQYLTAAGGEVEKSEEPAEQKSEPTQIVICFSELTDRQKKLLRNFLKAL